MKKHTLADVINLAQAMMTQQQYPQAEQVVEAALGQHPEHPHLLFLAGNLCLLRNSHGTAMALLEKAIAQDPEFHPAAINLATAYRREHQIGKARNLLNELIQKGVKDANLRNNMASTYVNEGNPKPGLKHIRKALELNPQMHKAKWNEALLHLEMGDFAEGLNLYRYGLISGERMKRNYSEKGETPFLESLDQLLPGQTVVVYGEQGIGDELMFGAPLQVFLDVCDSFGQGRGIKVNVILDTHPRLASSFARTYPNLEVHGTRKDEYITWPLDRKIDWQIGSPDMAGLVFNGLGGKRPHCPPYLTVDANLMELYRQELGSRYPNVRRFVGLAWTGGVRKTNVAYRSMDLSDFKPLMSDRSVRFVSLQYEDHDAEIKAFNEEMGYEAVISVPAITRAYDYERSIALIDCLDAVVTVNTSAVHVCGAIGQKAFVLTPNKPAWRYYPATIPEERQKGPRMEMAWWHPEVVQQYVQAEDGKWNKALTNLRADLYQYLNKINRREESEPCGSTLY